MFKSFLLLTNYQEVKRLGKGFRRNDQRSNTKNPNNPAYKADRDNRSRQLTPEDEVYEQSREKKED